LSPKEPIDKGEGRFITHWDPEDKMDPEDEKVKLEPKYNGVK
jgi:hypothetical protein